MQNFFLSIAAFVIAVSMSLASGAFLAHEAAAGAVENDMHHHMQGEAAFGEPGNPKKVTRTVTITATEIAFDIKKLTVKKGETVRFVLVNKGEQPHELTIAGEAEQIAHRKMMQQMAGMSMDHSDANNVSAEPGETKELVWTFTKAGTIEFACNYPGHAEVGMVGEIEVK